MEKPDKNKHKSRTRPRKKRREIGSRPYKNYSDEMLEIACEVVKSNQISSRDAERLFGIPRRTILNKIKKKHTKSVGHPTTLTDTEEKNIVKVLQASSDFGSPLSKLDLKLLVHQYLKKNSQDQLFKNQIPGDAWVQGFLARHADKLCLRSTQNISKARAEKGPEEMTNYFDNLAKTLQDVPPKNIVNFDETNLSDDPGSFKGIFRRGVKYPERVVNSSKGNISLMFTATASGECLPMYVVYKASNLYSEWISGGPPETRYNCTKSGWFDSATFEDYFEKVIVPWAQRTPGTKVVICDNLSSHLSIKVVELCDQNNIKFVFIPPRSTHLTQPLDVAFFAPVKKAWRKILYQYKLQNPSQTSLNKKHFPKLLLQLLEDIKLQEENNIKSGFRATGIIPLNPQEVLKKIPEMHEEIMSYGIDQALVDFLKETRAPKPLEVKRSKKVICEPGKSVTVSDFIAQSTKHALEANTNRQPKKKTKVPKVQKKNGSTIVLDEKTGIFKTMKKNENQDCVLEENLNTFEHQNEEDEIICFHDSMDMDTDANNETYVSLSKNPESLSMICINVINSHLEQSENHVITTPTCANDLLLMKASTSTSSSGHQFMAKDNNKIPAKTGPAKITILSNTLIVAGRPKNLTYLKDVTNTIENTPFSAVHNNTLPELLKPKKTEPLIKIKKKNTSSKVPSVRSAVTSQKRKERDESSLISSETLHDIEPLPESSHKMKPEVLGDIKKRDIGKNKKNVNSQVKLKKEFKGKKPTRASNRRKTKRSYSTSSSISADSNFQPVTADSDNSDYETMYDCYIAECLREQEDKENFEDSEVPFGLHDIEYFTADHCKLKKDDWIIARFTTKKSVKHFVGKILSVKNEIPTVQFVRKVKESKIKKGTTFSYPTVDDICTIPLINGD